MRKVDSYAFGTYKKFFDDKISGGISAVLGSRIFDKRRSVVWRNCCKPERFLKKSEAGLTGDPVSAEKNKQNA